MRHLLFIAPMIVTALTFTCRASVDNCGQSNGGARYHTVGAIDHFGLNWYVESKNVANGVSVYPGGYYNPGWGRFVSIMNTNSFPVTVVYTICDTEGNSIQYEVTVAASSTAENGTSLHTWRIHIDDVRRQ